MEAEPPKSDSPKRKRRWFQFSLRTLLVFTLICAVACAFGCQQDAAETQRATIDTILKRQAGL